MPRKCLVLVPLLFCIAVCVHETRCPHAVAGLDQAKAAYERGDYATAYKEFKALAERGDAKAQYNLGVMYGMGQGVPKDNGEAVKWFRKAAEQGVDVAQHNLGIMYFKGTGVLQDLVQAHMWFNLAAVQGYSEAQKGRDTVAKKMTPSQIFEAQRLAREWKPKGKQ